MSQDCGLLLLRIRRLAPAAPTDVELPSAAEPLPWQSMDGGEAEAREVRWAWGVRCGMGQRLHVCRLRAWVVEVAA